MRNLFPMARIYQVFLAEKVQTFSDDGDSIC